MDKEVKVDHLSSAAAFVKGGIQDACDDACSICLEDFCINNPSTVTGCKHEFHLQCILDWCQRSPQCPMCWQAISLKDPSCQELLEAVEQERNTRANRTRSIAADHHPMLTLDVNNAELEECIIQQLAAAAALSWTNQGSQRGLHVGSTAHGQPQILVLATHESSLGGAASPAVHSEYGEPSTEETLPNVHPSDQTVSSPRAASALHSRVPAGQSIPVSSDKAAPCDFYLFAESFKARLNAVSNRTIESLTKSTRGWRERLFSRHAGIPDFRSDAASGEVSAGIAGALPGTMEPSTEKSNQSLAAKKTALVCEAGSSNSSAAAGSRQQ